MVLGSGGGAFAGAIRARDLGRRVLMVEHGTIGGTCVNIGCIPSKSLLVSSLHHEERSDAPQRAVSVKTALVERLRQKKYIDLIDEYGIELRRGTARLTGPHSVQIDGQEISAGAILIAAGARPAIPEIDGLADAGYLTPTSRSSRARRSLRAQNPRSSSTPPHSEPGSRTARRCSTCTLAPRA